jgi:hypothetical protein
MTTSIVDIYRSFLSGGASLDELRDWLALYQWQLSEGEEDLADEADVALTHLDDGYSDEFDLRLRLGVVLERYQSTNQSLVFAPNADVPDGDVLILPSGISRRMIYVGSSTQDTQRQFILALAV